MFPSNNHTTTLSLPPTDSSFWKGQTKLQDLSNLVKQSNASVVKTARMFVGKILLNIPNLLAQKAITTKCRNKYKGKAKFKQVFTYKSKPS